MQYKSNEIISKNYDVIVIGAGLAGMTLANKLAKDGRKVLLLEAHNKLGGFATWFKRSEGKHIFDVSLHGFPVGMIKTCKKYWNKEIAEKIHQLKSVRYINPQFEVETNFTKEDFINVLITKFNIKKETVEQFFNELASMNFYDNSKITNREMFEKFFPGRNDVIRFLLEPIVYANGSNLEDPAISYGIVFSNFMSKGVYIFNGGTDLMISMMKDELLKNGVDIKLQSKVDQIIIENNTAKGVITKGNKIFSKAVVSNANLKATILKMIDKKHFDSSFLEEVNKIRLNTSSCQVYMGLKEGESIPFVGDLIFTSEDESFSTDQILSPDIGSQTFSMYYPESRPHLPPMYTIVSSSNARYEDWSKLTDVEYKEKKDFLIKKALTGIEKIVPGITQKISFVEAATPLTIEKYTHHLNGSSFGTKFEGLPISMELHKKINGLFHSGSVGIIMSGWLGAANYGIIQSHQVETFLSSLDQNGLY